MKLLGRSSSINVRKVLWTCAELGLTPAHDETDTDIRALNPKGLVPVLVDGGLVLTESNTICRYLAAREGRHDLLPETPAARAQVESWMDWQASDLNTAWRGVFMGRVRNHPDFADPAVQDASIRDWTKQMRILEDRLSSTGAYAAGGDFTLADIVLALSTNRWERTPMDRPALPAIAAWMDRLSSRPGFSQHCRNGVP
ncbi:glutathione S-transferase family protein [Hwanghaeella grinnelliae]|uniref:Glutathione S-transferase family protein n=1 Tax=Hwanghaeella grinnelliae TaxID=2500179 RepID=A0A437QQL0_9PROT|nr:glutathione S-transferase family protein [Hwanghaeella grinnelliae]RVU36800.1 glutathione S-transferase family protein [Hwanghaeella grinnelliae]